MTRTLPPKASLPEVGESCVFPPLHYSRPKAPQWTSTEAPKAVGSQIDYLSGKSGQPRHLVLATVWSVILRRYIESSSIQIWLSITAPQHDPERMHAQITTIDPKWDIPFPILLKCTSWSTAMPEGVEEPNTGVIVLDEPRCDILLALYQSRGRVRVVLSYRESMLLTMHASSILEQLQHLTLSISNNMAQTVGDLWSISDCDLRQLQRWNSRRSSQPTDRLMHEIIHQRALETPDKMAVESWDGVLTYRRLDSLASHLASRLTRHCIGQNDFVPISFHKSRWAIVSMLAINRCGAAFVPVDPSVPAERLAKIIRQTGARVALADKEQCSALRKTGISVVTVTEMMEYESVESPIVSSQFSGYSAPAYCLFTSGSMGEPKGCVVGQAAFAGITNHCNALYLQSDSRVLQFASLGFGMALIEIFCALSCGATVCIPSDEARMNSLGQAITSMNVNWTVLSPTTLNTLSPADVACLKTIVLGGEPVLGSHISNWGLHARLIQIYGLTECSGVFTVSNQIFLSDLTERSVGYPVDGRCWIVDPQDHNRLRAIGAVGELLIDTPNLAQGYLHDSERTNVSFVSAPSWIEKEIPVRNSRPTVLYKTGDLARFNPDGSICHLGRKDRQLKVRGQRVESSELEYHLRQVLSDVEDVVVDMVIPTGSNGVPSLTAFILEAGEPTSPDRETVHHPILAEPTIGFLQRVQSAKQSLIKIVPDYMVPALFFALRKVPQTISGKKDRRRLRQEIALMTWDQLRAYSTIQNGGRRVTPALETRAEHLLAQIWAELLRLDADTLGPDDDFLALGGDSIVAMRAVAMARIRGLGLTVSDIFAGSKLADMAKRATVLPSGVVASHRPVSLVTDNVQEVCISRLREQTSLLEFCSETPLVLPATETQKFFIDRSCFDYFCYILNGDLDSDKMQTACTEVVNKHSVLRTVFTQNDHGVFQVILPSMKTPLYHVTTARNVSAVAEKLWSSSRSATLPLDHPAIRFILISNNDANQHAMVLRLSHAQYDGFSYPSLVHDLAAAYAGVTLPPRSQFFDYIRYRSQQDPTAGYNFWREYLASSTMTDLRDCSFESGARKQGFGPSEAVDAKATITSPSDPPDGITMATLIKAAGALVLGQLTQRSDIIFGQTVNGRSGMPLGGIETMLGPCVNFLPIRVHIQPSWTAVEFLRHVQDRHIQTTAYDHMEFTDIIEKSTSWASDTRFGAIFHHQNIDTKLEIFLSGLKNTSATCHLTGSYFNQQMRSEAWIYSMFVENDLQICMRAPPHILDVEQATELLHKIAAGMQTLAQHPDRPLAEIDINVPRPYH
ncbi:non-ribosomal peptide synthase [Aspergillus udagawae]|nr:non-ribosomal peptide synthase [Aspergillus udagawae]GFF56991.1 non-ribosomal peptide synthase [Aspergillus udagawae]